MLSPSSKESKDKLSHFSFKSSSQKKDDTPQDPNTKGLISSPLSLSDESSHNDHRHNQHLDGDQLSLTSSSKSNRSSRTASRLSGLERQDSLIFERMVQDPLIDSQPVPTSLPRHFASENFIPASMDTISNNDVSDISPSEFNSPRRSSTANLQAAFANSTPSSPNVYARKHSVSTSNLARALNSPSYSNLTSQLQSPQQQNRPQLGHSNTYSSHSNTIPFPQQANTPQSPKLKQTKSSLSFCSYADMITQEDQESKYQIRRPSLSLSISHPRLSRTNSMCSNNQMSQRSPTQTFNNPSTSPKLTHPSHSFSFSSNPNIARIPTQNRRGSNFKGQTSPIQFNNNSAVNIPSALHHLQQPKKFTLDAMSSSDSDEDSCSCSARKSLAGLSRKSSVVAPVRMSSGGVGVNYGSINSNNNNNNNNIDDLLIDNVSSGTSGKKSSDEESSLHSYHGGVALKG